jgi:hypothetical protein
VPLIFSDEIATSIEPENVGKKYVYQKVYWVKNQYIGRAYSTTYNDDLGKLCTKQSDSLCFDSLALSYASLLLAETETIPNNIR